jgi:formylmethanofuran dehydrogenase subunit E
MTELPPPELFAEIWRCHGHRCPMSTLGGRLGWAARRRLPAGDLYGVYCIDTCALDGIRCATGCGEADGTLAVRAEGRHLLRLVERESGAGIVVELRPETLAMAAEYRHLDDALERDRAGLAPEELQRRLREKETFLDGLIGKLCSLADDRLLLRRPLPPQERD